MYRVIIADDEPWIAYGLVHLIEWELYGFTVCGTAEDGVDALEQCLTLKPDVLISDIRMPGMDGLELLEKLRCKMPDLIVIFVSGYSEFEYAQRAVRLGAFDYLLKPAAAEDLTGLLSRLKSPLRNIQQRAYQDSYFALLDTDNDVTIGQWTEPGNHTPNFQSCFFLTFDAAADSQQDIDYLESLITSAGHEAVFLRTGIEKYSALVKILNSQQSFRESLRIRLEGRHCGVSEEGTASSRLYRLYKQSDIAHCTSIIDQTQRVVHYNQLPPNNTAQQLLSQLAQSLIAGNTGLCYIQIEKLVEFCSGGIMLDDVRRIHERVLSLLQRYGKTRLKISECEIIIRSLRNTLRSPLCSSHAGSFSSPQRAGTARCRRKKYYPSLTPILQRISELPILPVNFTSLKIISAHSFTKKPGRPSQNTSHRSEWKWPVSFWKILTCQCRKLRIRPDTAITSSSIKSLSGKLACPPAGIVTHTAKRAQGKEIDRNGYEPRRTLSCKKGTGPFRRGT